MYLFACTINTLIFSRLFQIYKRCLVSLWRLLLLLEDAGPIITRPSSFGFVFTIIVSQPNNTDFTQDHEVGHCGRRSTVPSVEKPELTSGLSF